LLIETYQFRRESNQISRQENKKKAKDKKKEKGGLFGSVREKRSDRKPGLFGGSAFSPAKAHSNRRETSSKDNPLFAESSSNSKSEKKSDRKKDKNSMLVQFFCLSLFCIYA
jgi:hypothetical protein